MPVGMAAVSRVAHTRSTGKNVEQRDANVWSVCTSAVVVNEGAAGKRQVRVSERRS